MVVVLVKVEQWALQVPKKKGEETRQQLIANGLLDTSLKPFTEGDTIFFPLARPGEGGLQASFEAHEKRLLPVARHELIGGIAVLQESDRAAAEALLASRPGIHTVLSTTSDVQGEYRTREFEVLAGVHTTRTLIIEYGHRFTVDLSEAYFSPRLATERQRVLQQMTKGEAVLDMFAGVGPFAISLSKSAGFVVSSDINPAAVIMMKENCLDNHCTNVMPVLADSGRLSRILPWKFNRVVMNLPLLAPQFLDEAFRLCLPGGTIHCYALVSSEGEHLEKISSFQPSEVHEHMVRSYSPGKWHAVYEITAGK
ncbi:MAG: class I SAM-dependent methyltransferase family protein [Methanomicrobiales archaeon]